MVESSENQTARWIGERTRPRVHLSSVPLDMPTLVYEGVQRFGRLRRVGDLFAYGVMPLNDDARSWAITNFYGIIEFFIRTAKTELGRGPNPLPCIGHG